MVQQITCLQKSSFRACLSVLLLKSEHSRWQGRGRTENERLDGCSCSAIDALCVFHSPVLYLKEMSEQGFTAK